MSAKRGSRKAVLLALLLTVTVFFGYLYLGIAVQMAREIHWSPTYAQEDISPLLHKAERTEEDYAKIYEQTGLTRLGVEGLIEQNLYSRILRIQENYFTSYEKTRNHFAPFTYAEYIDGKTEFAIFQDGDVIVTDAIFCSWFRYGHAELVVDANIGQTIGAVEIGKESAWSHVSQFNKYAKFLILRPKASDEVKRQVVEYAKKNLVGLPYRLTAGILTAKDAENLRGTHCGHLVWYAYHKFGVDLDSSGGMVVTPRDIVNSDQVEVVQNFGFDPQLLWR